MKSSEFRAFRVTFFMSTLVSSTLALRFLYSCWSGQALPGIMMAPRWEHIYRFLHTKESVVHVIL